MTVAPASMPRIWRLATTFWLGLVAAALGAGDADKAFEQARRALRQGDYDAAIAQLDDAIRLDPDNSDAYRARGQVYQKLGEEVKANADFAKAKELEADN